MTVAVQKAMESAPCSLRALADAAGVDHTTLVRVRRGERAATQDLAAKVATALEAWGWDCTQAAKAIRHTTKRPEEA